jgi:GNAT superfamily N-acetyltransferase
VLVHHGELTLESRSITRNRLRAMNDDTELQIREATASDAAELSPLLAELGYPTPPELVRARLSALGELDAHALVAVRAGRVIALATVQQTRYLHRPPDMRLTSLVVSSTERGTGIGRRMMDEVERRGRAEGCARVELTSGSTRDNAHAFYEHLGYEAQSRRFTRPLGSEQAASTTSPG